MRSFLCDFVVFIAVVFVYLFFVCFRGGGVWSRGLVEFCPVSCQNVCDALGGDRPSVSGI